MAAKEKSNSLFDQLASLDSQYAIARPHLAANYVFNGEPVKASFTSEIGLQKFLESNQPNPSLFRTHNQKSNTLVFSNLKSFFEMKLRYNQGIPDRHMRLLLDGFNDSKTATWRSPPIPNIHKLLVKVSFTSPL